jgi:hypothetical protein
MVSIDCVSVKLLWMAQYGPPGGEDRDLYTWGMIRVYHKVLCDTFSVHGQAYITFTHTLMGMLSSIVEVFVPCQGLVPMEPGRIMTCGARSPTVN